MVVYDYKTCPVCGINYAMDKIVSDYKRSIGKGHADAGWYCPNGHALIYTESDADVLRRERDRLLQDNARLTDEVLAAQKAEQKAVAEKKRIERRANAGVCQCCNRTFANVARHMKTKHPNVTPLKGANA